MPPQVLLNHSDEVWHLQFSHDGEMLASCGKDQTAIIWDVQRSDSSGGGGPGSKAGGGARGSTVSKRHVLRGHSGPIAFLCWSPDDSKLATCGEAALGALLPGAVQCSLAFAAQRGHASHFAVDTGSNGRFAELLLPPGPYHPAGQDALRLWDVASGECLGVLRHHKDPVTCAAWFPDGRRLVTGSHDKQLCVVGLDGSVERQWRIQRIQEVVVAKGGRYILVGGPPPPPPPPCLAAPVRRAGIQCAALCARQCALAAASAPSLLLCWTEPRLLPCHDAYPCTALPLQATTCERKVRVYDLEGDSESYIPEAETLISMSLSRDGRYLLVNLTSNSMHLWDLGDAPREMHLPAMPCASYQGANVSGGGGCLGGGCLGGEPGGRAVAVRGSSGSSQPCRLWALHVCVCVGGWVLCAEAVPCAVPAYPAPDPQDKQSRFVVRSCLGGLDDRFVLTGSEECRVYVYHRATGAWRLPAACCGAGRGTGLDAARLLACSQPPAAPRLPALLVALRDFCGCANWMLGPPSFQLPAPPCPVLPCSRHLQASGCCLWRATAAPSTLWRGTPQTHTCLPAPATTRASTCGRRPRRRGPLRRACSRPGSVRIGTGRQLDRRGCGKPACPDSCLKIIFQRFHSLCISAVYYISSTWPRLFVHIGLEVWPRCCGVDGRWRRWRAHGDGGLSMQCSRFCFPPGFHAVSAVNSSPARCGISQACFI